VTTPDLSPVSIAHADVLAGLHQQCFEDAWDHCAMAGLLASPGVIGLAGGFDRGGGPQGFALARLASDEAEILSIGVLPVARAQGLGRTMLAALLAQLRLAGATVVFLEVATGNTAARALYQRLGFRAAGLRKGYYSRPGQAPEDAMILTLGLAAP
jgi:[ribosomal protein S18]-alanine N-acetyltransferase